MKPPAIVLSDAGAEVQFGGVRYWGFEWSQVREVAIEVLVVAEVDYSEAFWKLTGPVVEFGAPVELVFGADEFNARMFALSGFKQAAYRAAREAESKAEPGFFVCWRD